MITIGLQNIFLNLDALLAMLTSASKDEREMEKRHVRERVRAGRDVLQAKQDAANLASFANRHES